MFLITLRCILCPVDLVDNMTGFVGLKLGQHLGGERFQKGGESDGEATDIYDNDLNFDYGLFLVRSTGLLKSRPSSFLLPWPSRCIW